MAGDVVERAKKGGKKGGRRPKRRVSIRIDMTPMVDIAFLLLIFYMVTTVFAMPQAMEINLPPIEDEEEVEIKESNLISIRVDGDGRFWWNPGTPNPENLPRLLPSAPDTPDTIAYRFWPDTLRNLLVATNRENPRLNTLILIHRDANYKDMVNILDEIDLIERSWNDAIARSLDKDVEDLTTDDGKFSYRYAMGKWEDRDNKVMEAAVAAAAAKGEL